MDRENQISIVNTQFRHTLLAINQVLGGKSTRDVYRAANLEGYLTTPPPDDLHQTFSSHDYARLLQTIETLYGQKGPSILERIGREAFHLVLREQSTIMSSARRVIKLRPPEQSIEIMIQTIVDTQRKTYPDVEIWMEEKNGQLAYIEQNCHVCAGRQSSQPVCHLTVGFINEALQWATGRKIKVSETNCSAMGDAFCRFSTSLDNPHRKQT